MPTYPISDHCDGERFFNPHRSARLVGVSALDTVLWATAAALLVAVAIAASIKPAFAAARVDINETLRAL